MKTLYRKLFLRDLKKLKKQPVYADIINLVFTALPAAKSLKEIAGVKAMQNYSKRYSIRVGSYRVGIEVQDNTIEVMRVLHRREFYRYFP